MSISTAADLGTRRLLSAAGQAPSILNTQPWRFDVVTREFVELYADPDRRLRVSDPRGRSLHVSCGAALFNLRLAMRVSGQRPMVWLLPEPDDEPGLLAAVRAGGPLPVTQEQRELYDLIPVRRTSRLPFTARPVPLAVMAELRIAASREGATLLPLSRAAAADLLDYAAIAEDELTRDHAYQAELAAWTMAGARFDGVPAYAHGPRPLRDPSPVRDFGRRSYQARFEERPQLAVLSTPGDRPLDWLRAGQALQRVLLVAARHGLSASFLNQPLDLRDMRRRRDPHHRRGHPQMIIRFGYGPYVARAPRRPAAELETPHE
ncbi:nitroreductase family protein [Actinomadura sp. ATCC 31491]|uniref:Nitroreductase family protein n=1 Tax=Actinomadura luzonensis TaxID=2805427 RepID=A0ABT0FUC2_9ACTN|nr:nitroreductase family protein [Actinomadura luzonensis]MCK2215916.1 nitroreductase family protein [Actinomadura luzonensis]